MDGTVLYVYITDGIVGNFLLVRDEDDGVITFAVQFVEEAHNLDTRLCPSHHEK